MMTAPLLPYEVAEFRRRRRPAQGRAAVIWLTVLVAAVALIFLGRCA